MTTRPIEAVAHGVVADTPSVSVVMGAYNGATHLIATVESVLAQEGVALELVVVDDASTDRTAEILADFVRRDPRVRVLRQEVNQGLTRALITGCAAARASLIARQDVGDLSHPLRLATQQALMDASADVVFVSCATQFVGPELEPLWVARSSGMALKPAAVIDLSRAEVLSDGPTHHGSVMFRRTAYQLVGGYRAAFMFGQDFDLWFRLAEVGKFQMAPDVLYTARILPNGISNVARSPQWRLAALSRAALEARQAGRTEDTILAQAAAVERVRIAPSPRIRAAGLYFIGEALRRNRDRRARRYLSRAILQWPISARAWLRLFQSMWLS